MWKKSFLFIFDQGGQKYMQKKVEICQVIASNGTFLLSSLCIMFLY